MDDQTTNDPLGDGPDFMVFAMLRVPNPGDIIIILNGDPSTVHWLNGPYEKDQIEEVLSMFANEQCQCGDKIDFFWEQGEDSVNGSTLVWHESHLN